MDVPRDDYIVFGVCDYDCDDMDVCANDECDYDSSRYAGVFVDRTSSIDIEVSMFECDEVYCYYALILLRD